MRNLKRPTRKQKKRIQEAKLDWKNWLVASESDEEMVLYNKKSERRRTIK